MRIIDQESEIRNQESEIRNQQFMLQKKMVERHRNLLLCVIFLFLIQACSSKRSVPLDSQVEDLKPALQSVTADDLLQHIRVLASDEFEGRAPGTRGERLTVEYLTEQFKKLGLRPGNPDGTYVQNVPLAAIKCIPAVSFTAGRRKLSLAYPADYVAVSRCSKQKIEIGNSDVVFVGYGIIAPEYGWDDYKGVDVQGKTLIILTNDPPVPDPADPSKLDNSMFEGKAMTYYGRWTYKYETAAQQKAAAAILVHETQSVGYPYGVLVSSLEQESLILEKTEEGENNIPVESWIRLSTTKRLFSFAGFDFLRIKKAALKRSFRPVSLGVKANFLIKNAIRKINSQNVVAKLEGSDPMLREQCVIYSAHWDHLGKSDKLKGDKIYNGALDNASGTAGLLEIAKAYTKLHILPKRTTLFLAFTGEEKGLLGSRFYTENPLYPLAKTVADINQDGMNPWGCTRDIAVIGLNSSPLHNIAREVARSQGRRIEPDLQPEKGFFYRSDHYEFARRGIPTLFTDAGIDMIGKPAEYGLRKRGEYTRRNYHNVTDEVKPDWDLSGAVEDLKFLFLVGYKASGL